MTAVRRAGRLLLRFLVLEVRLYRALALWARRRRSGEAPGVTAVGYSRLVTPVMGLWIFASALEVPLLHVITPWEHVRLALDVLGIWGVVWMLGLLASMKVHPHLVSATTLRLRHGVLADVSVPRAAVTGLQAREQEWPGTLRSVHHGADGALAVAVSGRTNVVATLRPPTVLDVDGEARTVSSVAFWVDEPRELLREHRASLPG